MSCSCTAHVQVVYGGSNINSEKKRLQQGPQILVGTPGRLLDHLANEGLARRLSRLSFLCFDEADQLLDMGFRQALPRKSYFCKKQQCLHMALGI